MACYHPVEVTIRRKAVRSGGFRVSDQQVVPCGRCIGCRAEQARQWSVRIMHEMQMHSHAWFVTLTYNDERIPANGSLAAQDFSRFVKTLRRDYPPKTISYYGCGEYGESTQRPHYHAVLFGPDFLDRNIFRTSRTSNIWRAESLERNWPHGRSEFGSVTPASAAYVAGYVRKKISKKVYPDAYTRVDTDTGELVEIEKEFARMSLKPAIGRRWIEKYWRDVYPRDFVVMSGVEMKPPRYYDKWLERERPQMFMNILERRYAEATEIEPDKLRAKEKIHEARIDLFQRRNKV